MDGILATQAKDFDGSTEPTEVDAWSQPGPRFVFNQFEVNEYSHDSGDFQAIHLNPDAAKKQGFPGTIVHGGLIQQKLLFMTPWLMRLLDSGRRIRRREDTCKYHRPVPVGEPVYLISCLSSVKPGPRGKGVEKVYTYKVILAGNNKQAVSGTITLLFLPVE